MARDGERVRVKKADPNETHPYTMKQLINRVNAKRKALNENRTLTSHDHQALCWKEGLRDDSRMAWKHSNSATYGWSGDAVRHMSDLTDEYYDQVRSEYREHLRGKEAATSTI